MSSSLDLPRTRKSIPIALAFALRACVRAKLRGRDASAVAGVGQMQVPGGPSPRPAGPRSRLLLPLWLAVQASGWPLAANRC